MVSSTSSTTLESIKQKLQNDSDAATLSSAEIKQAYEFFKTYTNDNLEAHDNFQAIFWLYISINETDDA